MLWKWEKKRNLLLCQYSKLILINVMVVLFVVPSLCFYSNVIHFMRRHLRKDDKNIVIKFLLLISGNIIYSYDHKPHEVRLNQTQKKTSKFVLEWGNLWWPSLISYHVVEHRSIGSATTRNHKNGHHDSTTSEIAVKNRIKQLLQATGKR